MFRKTIKRKVLEKKNDIYLIERFYKKINLIEYIICSNYHFGSNTFLTGIQVYDLPTAYRFFNEYVKTGYLPGEEDAE